MLEYRYDTQLLIEGSTLDEDALFAKIANEIPGDCLLVVGDKELMKIHYHTNIPWRVLETCAGIGEIYDIIVEDMVRQSNGQQG